ncbi:MAG: DUF4231 domain-containing protein [Frankiaceae bacterium]
MADPIKPARADRARQWARPAGQLPEPAGEAAQDVVWQALRAHFEWHDRAASRSRKGYVGLRTLTLAAAATIPVESAGHLPAVVAAALGAVILVAEGVQQTLQLHAHWISYRAMAEGLRQQAVLYVAGVEPYADPATRRAALATALMSTVSQESATWSAGMRQGGGDRGGQAA